MKKTYIVSCYFKKNYGSMLQAYATQEFLNLNEIENETINISYLVDFQKGKKRYYKKQIFNYSFLKAKFGMIKLKIKQKLNRKIKRNFRTRDNCFSKFEFDYFKLTKPFRTYHELTDFCNDNAANVIVGSDQLWLPVNVVADYYTLNFVPDSVNKISYSTSFGVSNIPSRYKEKYSSFISRIDCLSVREESGKKIVDDLIKKECKVVCDPTMLLSQNQWLKLVSEKPIIEGDYIFCYFLGKNIQHRKFVERIKKITGYKIVSINHCDEYVKYSDKFADIVPYNVGPSEWLNMIKNAKYVCTDSFHGTVFSLIFNKLFFSFRRHSKKNKYSTNSRLDTLLNYFGLRERIIEDDNLKNSMDILLNSSIDFELLNSNLSKYKEASASFLLSSLKECEKKQKKHGIILEKKSDCCGCTACYNACPQDAITMKEDKEGFLYPSVNQDKCIDCGLCNKVCRIKNPIVEEKKEQTSYVIQNKNEEILKTATSGGFFTSLANYVIDNNGYVVGVKYSNNDMEVIHYCTNNKDELALFRGSKYVQSNLNDIFKKVKSLLDDSKLVLFNGTPCQVEGLLSFLRKKYSNLITVDNVCHSVPSRLVWRKYLEMQQTKYGKIDDAKFRDKSQYGYKYSQMALYKEKKCVYHKGVETDYMLRSFFSDVAIRPSCFDCKFKKRYRESDFTIWDCFEPNEFYKKLDNDKGVTRVLIHNESAVRLFNKFKDNYNYLEVNPDDITRNVKEMFFSVKMNPKREKFFDDLNNIEVEQAFKNTFPSSFKRMVNKIVRKTLLILHIYTPVKRLAKKIVKK